MKKLANGNTLWKTLSMRRPAYVIPAELLASIKLRLRGKESPGVDPMGNATNSMLAHMLELLLEDQDREEGEGISSSRLKMPSVLSEEEQQLKDQLLAETRKRFMKLTLRPATKKAAPGSRETRRSE